MEGNQMGHESAIAFGELLKSNRCIRFIDLEFNDLTENYTKFSGIQSICEVLQSSYYLGSKSKYNFIKSGSQQYKFRRRVQVNYSLFLYSNALKEAMEVNTTLINLDIEGNKKMNIHDVRQIQDYL